MIDNRDKMSTGSSVSTLPEDTQKIENESPDLFTLHLDLGETL